MGACVVGAWVVDVTVVLGICVVDGAEVMASMVDATVEGEIVVGALVVFVVSVEAGRVVSGAWVVDVVELGANDVVSFSESKSPCRSTNSWWFSPRSAVDASSSTFGSGSIEATATRSVKPISIPVPI